MNKNLKHHGFQYKLGLNIATTTLGYTDPHHPSGGLHFCSGDECHGQWDRYGKILAVIELPDGDDVSHILHNEKGYYSDKIIIKKFINREDWPNSVWTNILLHEPNALKFVEKQTPDLCLLAIQGNAFALEFVREQTDQMCVIAVTRKWQTIRHVKNQTTELCRLALDGNYEALRYIRNQTDAFCRYAIMNNHNALRYVAYQTEELYRYAIGLDWRALKYIMKFNSMNTAIDVHELCILAIEQDVGALTYVPNKTEEICRFAYERYGLASLMHMTDAKIIWKITTENISFSNEYVGVLIV